MNQTCYIVDDESHAVDLLSGYIRKTDGLELSGSSISPVSALEEIKRYPPDLLFLDIDMPELTGLELSGLVNQRITVIFTTAFREYAPEAFEKEAADYLLKPVSYERFYKAVQKTRGKFSGDGPSESFLFVKAGLKSKFIRVPVAEISYVTAAKNYVEIHIKEQVIVTYTGLNELFIKLPETDFSRVHNSYIINHHLISTLEYGQIKLIDKTIIPIGRVFRKAFYEKLKIPFSKSHYDQPE